VELYAYISLIRLLYVLTRKWRQHHHANNTENYHAKILLSVLKFPTLYYSKMKTQRFFEQWLYDILNLHFHTQFWGQTLWSYILWGQIL